MNTKELPGILKYEKPETERFLIFAADDDHEIKPSIFTLKLP